MTIEGLGTALIVAGIILALTLGLPLIVGIIRLDASNKRLLEYATQLASRSSRPEGRSASAAVWTGNPSPGRPGSQIALRRATLVAVGSVVPITETPESAPRRLTVASPES